MFQLGGRSSRRFTCNGGYRGISKFQNWAARCRRRGVMDPIHAAFIQGLGDSWYKHNVHQFMPNFMVFNSFPSFIIRVQLFYINKICNEPHSFPSILPLKRTYFAQKVSLEKGICKNQCYAWSTMTRIIPMVPVGNMYVCICICIVLGGIKRHLY